MQKLKRLLLGPQRPIANLESAIHAAQIPDEPVAVISAAWQEAEADIEELQEQLQRPVVPLNLYQRAEEIFAIDKKLHSAYRQRQDQLQELQQLYRARLRQLMIAARQLWRTKDESSLLDGERRHAIAQVRELDMHQLSRIQDIYGEYEADLGANSSEQLAEHIEAVRSAIEGCATTLITGGNVLVLLNRLQLFDVQSSLASRHLIAWSAGAMALSEKVVLFHDNTPLGRRDPEVLGPGMSIIPGYIFLPDAKHRLKEKDKVRAGLLNERFAPAECITFNNGSLLHLDADRVHRVEAVGHLGLQGNIHELGTS